MAIASRFPDIDIPDRTLPQFVLDNAAGGDHPAIVDGASGRTITYANLHEGGRRLAAGLAGHGLGRGDVLAVMMPNQPELAVIYHGALTAGGVLTMLRPMADVREVAAQLNATHARFVVTIPSLLPIAHAAAETAHVERVFVVDTAEGAAAFGDLLAHADALPPVPLDPARDPAVLLYYSSSTTGLSRVARLTHHALVAAVRQVEALAPVGPSERLICPIPFTHLAGQTLGMNQTLRAGATVVVLPEFDLGSYLALIQQHRVTTALAAPPVVLALAADPLVDRYDLSSLERILCAVAPLSRRRQSACGQRMGRWVGQCYGEAGTGLILAISPTDARAAPPGSAGMLVPNTQARVVDPGTGVDVGAGAIGELWVRGPQLMDGDVDGPPTTVTAPDDRWLRTGDLVRFDAEGWIFVVDRLTSTIVREGWLYAQDRAGSTGWPSEETP